MDEVDVRDRLCVVEGPDLGDDAASPGLVNAVEVDGDTVRIPLVLGAPYSPVGTDIGRRIREVLVEDGLEVGLTAKVPTNRDPDEEVFPSVKNIIAVAFGKGDVGKSTVAVNLAAGLSKPGACVGLFDADIYGPNVPWMVAAEEASQTAQGQITVLPEKYGMKFMLMTFLIGDDNPVIWRGPMVHQLFTQLVGDVERGSLDYLVLNLPPGTGDTQLPIPQTLPLTSTIAATTPQNVALDDANRGLWIFGKHDTNVLGIAENMSTFRCPDCGSRHDIFDVGGGREFAAPSGLPSPGALLLDPAAREGGDGGKPIVFEDDDETADAFRVMTENIAGTVGIVQWRSINER